MNPFRLFPGDPGIASFLIGGRSPAQVDQAFASRELNEPALFAELDQS